MFWIFLKHPKSLSSTSALAIFDASSLSEAVMKTTISPLKPLFPSQPKEEMDGSQSCCRANRQFGSNSWSVNHLTDKVVFSNLAAYLQSDALTYFCSLNILVLDLHRFDFLGKISLLSGDMDGVPGLRSEERRG